MQGQPYRHGKDDHGGQPIPGPMQGIGLHGINSDHEIVGEARVAEEAAIFRETFSDAADESREAERDDHEGNQNINGRHGIPFDHMLAFVGRHEIRIEPLSARPDKAETGLESGTEIGLRTRGFVQKQTKIKRHYTPNELDMLKGRN